MLVGNDSTSAEIYQKKFEEAGFEVVSAANGKEAAELAKDGDFDAVLLSLVLLDMDGADLIKELKKNDENLKIIALGDLGKAENEKEAKEKGADGFIGKAQNNPNELVTEVQRLLREYAEQKKNKHHFLGIGDDEELKNKKRILFIEDEEIFLEMFGKKLEDDGFEVEYAKNGAWGSKMAAENQYDLIITDVVMPAMTGDEIIRRIKLDDKTKNLPLIALSASLDEAEVKMIKELGVENFYEKTRIIPSELSEKVAELLK